MDNNYFVIEQEKMFNMLEPICDCCNLNVDCDFECPLSIFVSEILKYIGE